MSLQGFTSGRYDYRQMYDIKDIKGPLPYPELYENSMMGRLNKNDSYKSFVTLLKRYRRNGLYNDLQANMTLFVPMNIPNIEYLLQRSFEANKFIERHTLDFELPVSYIQGITTAWIKTRLPPYRILLDNRTSEPLLNFNSRIVGVERTDNGTIYFIDNALDECTRII